MSPRSRSRSISRRSYTRSPVRRSNGRRRHSRDKTYRSRSRSASRHPPSPPPPPPGRAGGRYSETSKSSSTSLSPRHARRASRSRTRSPYDKRRGNRDQPIPNRCIGVFGLSVYTTQQKIREIFSRFGPIERIQVVIDAQTGRSRGFCFIYYEELADARAAKDACSGMEVDERRIRVDFSTTQRPHTPTPGVYMGRAVRRDRDHNDRYRDDHRSRRRSVSPYSRNNNYRNNDRRRRYDRSRSRSYSPRRTRY